VVVLLELATTSRLSKEYSVENAYWTLVRAGDAWSVEHVESGAEGTHYLSDPLPEEGSDQEELHDEATISTAAESVASDQVPVAELIDADATTHSQLLDLSVVDGRYAPDVISACVCEIARAWEAATAAGDRKLLEPWCTPEAATQLFHPTPHGLRRVLNLETRRVHVDQLRSDVEPPTLGVTLELSGQRWLTTSYGMKLSGSRRRHRDFTEHWTLRSDPSTSCPWRLVHVDDPGRA
jgi:hypothetical protein